MARTADPQRRDAILTAARQTFERVGFADAKMTDIARRARIAVGTLYLYFDSKDAIARALASATFERAATVIVTVLEKPLTHVRVATLVDEVFEAVFQNPSVGEFGIPLADVAPTLAPEAYARVVTQIAWALDRQMEMGCIARYDPVTLADFMTILTRRAVLQSAMHGRRREPYQSTLTQMLTSVLLDKRAPAKKKKR